MDPVLVFLIFPIAVIIFSIALEKLLNSPILVSAIIFIVGLIIALVFFSGNTNAIIAVIVYAIIAFITALITRFILNFFNNDDSNNNNNNNNGNNRFPNTRACRICCCQRRLYNRIRNN